MAGTLQGGKEKALAPENCRFDIAHVFNVIMHGPGQGDQTPGINTQHLTCGQFFFHNGAAGMDKGKAVAIELLHDEPLSTKKGGPYFFLESHADGNSLGRTEKGIFLTDNAAIVFFQIQGDDLAGIGGGKSGLAFSRAGMGEHGDKQSFPGN